MTGTLVQIITITAFGNEFLRNGKLTDFYPENSSFQFCDFVDFREIKKKNFFTAKKEIITAKNPLDWFGDLKKMVALNFVYFIKLKRKTTINWPDLLAEVEIGLQKLYIQTTL
ncbi:MAG: hypothetical protein ACJAUR_002109, partial [Ulvibacter sp.]